jgi:hypothetical protein
MNNTKAPGPRQPRVPPPPPPPLPQPVVDDDDNVLALSCTHSNSSSENEDSPRRGGRDLIQAILQEHKSDDDDSCISTKEEARRYLIRYEAMVHQQEATQAATLAHLWPAWQRLFPNAKEISRAEWQRAHEQLQAAAADMSPDQFVTTDRPFMMLVRLLSEDSSSSPSRTTIWDFLQAYQITCHGMMLLEALDLSTTKTKTHRALVRHRTMAMAALALGLNSRKKSRTSRRCRLMLYATCFWLSSLVIGVTVVATVAYLFSSTEETVVSPNESATSTAAAASTLVENITTSPRLLPFLAEPVVVVVAQKDNSDLVPVVDKSVAVPPVATTVLPTPSTPVVAVAPKSDHRTESPVCTTSTTRKTLSLSATTATTHLPHWFQSLASSPDHDPPRLEVAAAVPTTLIMALLVTPSWPMIVASSLVVAVASVAVFNQAPPARAATTL